MTHHTFNGFLVLVLAIFLVGCGGGTTSDKYANASAIPTRVINQLVPVDVIVITQADGTGNPLWTRGYVDELLDTASALVGHAVIFQLASYTLFAEPHLYVGLQVDLLPLARAQRHPGRLTIVISRPDTEDYAGLTDQAGPQGRPDPYLVMRSRQTDWSGINTTAAILLHELGHCFGLFHKPEPFLYNGEIHTDDWWLREQGLQRFASYVRAIQGN